MLNEGEDADPARRGLARELARMNLTLNTYTQWYWKTNLHNLFHFLSLRADAHAQYEIRVYADEMLRMTEAWVPDRRRRLPRLPAGRGHAVGADGHRAQADAGRRGRHPGNQRLEPPRMDGVRAAGVGVTATTPAIADGTVPTRTP